MTTTRVLLLLLALLAFPLAAQDADPGADDSIDTAEYSARLDQTRILLDAALTGSTPVDAAAREIDALWDGVQAVRLPDGAQMPLDTVWLRIRPDATPERLDALGRQIDGLQRALREQGDSGDSALDPAALDDLLRDFQFTQADDDNLAIPDPFSIPTFAADAAALLLIAAALFFALVAGRSIVRSLRTESAALRDTVLHGEDPKTSTSAQELAEQAEQRGDYRSAVRYLYLACLLLLDERGLIHYDTALTNREHLQQITDPAVRDSLDAVVSVFDRVWYGFAPVSAAEYARYQQEVARLSQMAQAERQGA